MVTRLFDGGRVMPHHVRNSGTLRSTLTIKQEDDHIRHRTTLVARFSPKQMGSRVVPPLYDVVLIASTADVWTLAGYERVASGALQKEYFLGQSWVLTPAPLEDLRGRQKPIGRSWPRFYQPRVRRRNERRRPVLPHTGG